MNFSRSPKLEQACCLSFALAGLVYVLFPDRGLFGIDEDVDSAHMDSMLTIVPLLWPVKTFQTMNEEDKAAVLSEAPLHCNTLNLSSINFDKRKYSNSFYHILPRVPDLFAPTVLKRSPLSVSSYEIYASQDSKRVQSVSPARLYELSNLLSTSNMEDVVSGFASLPGTRPFILIEGWCKEVVERPCQVKVGGCCGEYVVLKVESAEVVRRLLQYHGEGKSGIFQLILCESERRFRMRGVHPCVESEDPPYRGKSDNYYHLLNIEPIPRDDIKRTADELYDVISLMKKAYESQSSSSSASSKAAIGIDSIDVLVLTTSLDSSILIRTP
jgi:hypothetical protein